MKQKFIYVRPSALRTFVVGFVLLALLAFVLPQAAQASTSGGATIYNTVKVNYTSGTTTLWASANVSVTVNVVGAAPTVTNPVNQTILAGSSTTYVYKVKSNSNGVDTYSTSARSDAATNISVATGLTLTASVQLWGGITTAASGAGTITIPFGTTAALTAGTSTVQIGANTYTVTTITAGTAASTDGSGNLVAEVPTTLTLTPIGASAPITAGGVTAGTQVGEFKASALTAGLTAGTPTILGTDGTYNTHFTITAGATPQPTVVTVDVITTVPSPRVTITKIADKANAAPGDVITYTITVTNTHATAQVTSATVTDPVPAYTTYVANSTRLNGGPPPNITVAGDGAVSPLIAGLLVDSNNGRGGGVAATGILPAGGVATLLFRVTVN